MKKRLRAAACRFISTGGLKILLTRKEKLQLWNVQSPRQYRTDLNIPGSEWVPARAISGRSIEQKIRDKDEPLVVYSGDRACPAPREAAQALKDFGCSLVLVYRGGIAEWGKAGLPLVNGAFLLADRSNHPPA